MVAQARDANAPINLDTGVVEAAEAALAAIGAARTEIGQVIFGQQKVVDLSLITLLAGGHGLLVGVPGLAKTKLVETMGIVLGMEGRPVTIRTLDIGADKNPGYLQLPREENPFLGWRSIRISFEMPDLFKQQLRAILRVATLGRVRLMFPMISSVEDIRRAKELLDEAKEELTREGR